jgi:hypothetical protein
VVISDDSVVISDDSVLLSSDNKHAYILSLKNDLKVQ